jgi:hypothetical protein
MKGHVMSKDKISKVLGVGEKLRDNDEGVDSESLSEEEKRKRHEERKKEVAKIKADIAAMKNNTDDDFIKEGLRELASIGLQSMRVLQDELEVDPSGRAVECMAAMSNATANALKGIQNVEVDKEKLAIEKEKVSIKKQTALPAGQQTNNILITGSVTDVLQTIRDQQFKNQEEIDDEVKEAEYVEKGKGSPFKKNED